MATLEARGADKDVFMLAGWRRNAFLWRYPLIVVVFDAGLVALDYCFTHFDIGFFIIIMLMFMGILLFIIFLLLAVVFLIKRRFKLASAVAFGVFLATPFGGSWVRAATDTAIDRARFHFLRGQYEAAIEKIPADQRASSIVFFDWGGGGGPLVYYNFFYHVVYDESDEIALSDAERTQAWKDRASPHESFFNSYGCYTSVSRLSGHFYSLKMMC
jgi:hypothetical protein